MKAAYLVVMILGISVTACDQFDAEERTYADAKEAISSGALDRGWIPTFLPASAKGITEKHNLDTNESWVAFSIDPNEFSGIEESCQKIEWIESQLPRIRAGDWWPESLALEGSSSQRASEYTSYQCENGGMVAVDSSRKRVFYWRHN